MMEQEFLDMTVPESVSGLWRVIRHRGYALWKRVSELTERFWLSRGYFPLLLGVLVFALAADRQVAGAAALVSAAVWFMALCPDFLASFCPFTLAILLVAPEYENMSVFLPVMPLLFLLAAAIALHFIVWPVKIRLGSSWRGLALVSAATILSGCDSLSLSARTTPLTLYYTLGLGAGMLVMYAVVRSHLTERKAYDVPERFARIWLAVGLGMSAVVAAICLHRLDEFAALGGAIPEFKCRNFCATILLTTFPAALYLSTRQRRYLLAAAAMVAAMLLTGSRSALIFGAILVVLGCAYLVRFGVLTRRTLFLLLALGAVFMALCGLDVLKTLYESRVVEGHFIRGNELRWLILAQSVMDFLNHPAFGVGLGNTANDGLFPRVQGSMFFYHNLPAQVAGSMGLLGIAAYARLIGDRISTLWKGRNDPFVAMLALSYLGMLLVSMTNPGEFCPFPNAAMMIMLFAVAEDAVGDVTVPLEQMLPGWHAAFDRRIREQRQ